MYTVYLPWWHTKEKIIGIWTKAPNFEDLNQVEELAMDVTHNRDRSLHMNDIALLHQQLLRLCTYCFDD